jgi:hypothetical protein
MLSGKLTLSGRSCEDTGAAGKRAIKYAKRDVFVFLFSIVIAVKIAVCLEASKAQNNMAAVSAEGSMRLAPLRTSSGLRSSG